MKGYLINLSTSLSLQSNFLTREYNNWFKLHNIFMRLCYKYHFVVYIILVYLASVPTYWWAAIHYTLMQIMTSEAQERAFLTGVAHRQRPKWESNFFQ